MGLRPTKGGEDAEKPKAPTPSQTHVFNGA